MTKTSDVEIDRVGRKALGELVATGGEAPRGIWANFCSIQVLQSERNRAADCGQCSRGCDATALVHHPYNGLDVCPHTWEVCEKRNLQPLLDIYGELNA